MGRFWLTAEGTAKNSKFVPKDVWSIKAIGTLGPVPRDVHPGLHAAWTQQVEGASLLQSTVPDLQTATQGFLTKEKTLRISHLLYEVSVPFLLLLFGVTELSAHF